MARIHKGKLKSLALKSLAVICALCLVVAGCYIWLTRDSRVGDRPDAVVDIPDSEVALASGSKKISAGDTVVAVISVDEMSNVYGYQFNLHYNSDKLQYSDSLYSDIDEIPTIFATERDLSLLVGATRIGDEPGFSGRAVQVCRIEFVALADFELEADFDMKQVSLSSVNIVTGDLQYIENAEGWVINLTVK